LTLTHLADKPIVCGGLGQCDYVNSSEYAYIGSVPVAALGAFLYVGLIGAAVYWALGAADDLRPIPYWGLSLAGFGYAAYLTYIELAVLRAICVWCVVSAVVLTTGLIVSTAVLFWPRPPEVGVTPSRRGRGSPRRASSPR
jgi:uncharacterized membrane protein